MLNNTALINVWTPPVLIPASRPLLIFNPVAEASVAMKVIINDFKPCKLSLHDLNTMQLTEENETNCFVDMTLQQQSTAFDRQRGFVIGSVQEPCHEYLSIWKAGSRGASSAIFEKLERKGVPSALYGDNAPHFNSTEDVERFEVWLSHPGVQGLFENRFYRSYAKSMGGVDCLVFMEDLHSSFLTCIAKYESQGGFVNWTSPELEYLKQVSEEEEQSKIEGWLSLPWAERHTSHQSECNSFFDEDLKFFIENGPEESIYERFGYPKCCSKQHFDNSVLRTHGDANDSTKSADSGNDLRKGHMLSFSISVMVLGLLVAIVKRSRIRDTTPKDDTESTPGYFVGEFC